MMEEWGQQYPAQGQPSFSDAGVMAKPLPQSDALVVFGVTGDLAYKKIFPALQALAARGQLERADRRRRTTADGARAADRARAQQRVGEGPVDEAAFSRLTSLLQYVSGDYGQLELFTQIRQALGDAQRSAVLSRDSAERVSDDRRASVARRLHRGRARRHRKAVRARSRVGAGAQRDAASRVFRRRDLPHRSLPRQGSGAEHPVLPVCERVSRAHLEPAVRRQRAHHDGRVVRRRRARRFLRRDRRHSRRRAEPSAADRRLPRDGAAVFGVARSAARRAGESAAHGSPASPAETVLGQFRGYREQAGVSKTSNVPTYAALDLFVDSWRWHGVPFHVTAGKCLNVTRTEVLVKLKPAPGVVFAEPGVPDGNHVRFTLSPQVSIAIGAQREAARRRHVRRAGRAVRHGERIGGAARRVRAPHRRRDGGRSHAVRAPGCGRSGVGDREPVLDHPNPLFVYDCGSAGPAEARSLVGGGWA